jgi:hypothetical protein
MTKEEPIMKRKRTEPLRVTLLRSLSTDGPQTSMDLTIRLNPYPDSDLTRGRIGVNSRLTDLLRAGHAEVAGKVPTEYHNTPAFLWRITPAGVQYLHDWRQHKTQTELLAERRGERKERRETALRQMIRDTLANGWGPETPTAQRRVIARKLRAQGLPYDWIAAIFDVSHECIRLDCKGTVQRDGFKIQQDPRVLPSPEGPGFVWARTKEGAA